ncbi:hypothetical protein LB504_013187, partial [Fusarium proliferatum]
IRMLINVFSQAKTLRPQLRVFLTSRPELPIRLGFSEVQGSYQDLILHDIPAQIVEHDIIVFLNDEFKMIRHDFNMTVGGERKLPPDWPGRPTVQSLAQMAVPLFIFAATVCRFIGDRKRDSPPIQLRKVLGYESKGHISQLDRTYGPVLHSLITDIAENDKTQIVKDFKIIVGSLVMLANPLSVWALSQLLEVDPDVVDSRLDTLHSVLSIPPTRKATVRLLHLSFRDYLLTNESEFHVDEVYTHQTLAKHCLHVMWDGLRENICDLSFPGTRRYTVAGSELEERIPPHLQYACMHWVYHQMEGESKLNDDNKVYDFLTTHFLHWVEAMSLLGRAKECLDSLKSLARWLENHEDSSLSTFLADAVRFIQANFSVVAEAPLQIYCCLAFAPSKTVLRKTLGNAIPKWIKNLPKVEENWDACLLTLEGHSGDVNSVVFSHNLKKVASGSYDWTIRIWDAETGKCERVLDGHSNRVRSVVFSHDSKKVASGSYDMTVRIWDAETGKCEKVLEGHSSAVYSVAFSHNLKKVASGSFDQTIRIWDTETSECKRVLEGHSSSVKSVVFSHDSKRVVSGSDDKTIQIWDAETGECERVLEGHSYSVVSAVFSHDSNKVASGSSDKTIRIWDTETGECKRVLQGHSDEVDSVVFSPESTIVASTSRDKTVRIWDVKTGKCEHRLEGHSGLFNSVVVSPHSTMVASALRDKTVRIWDAKTGACERILESHSDEVNSVVVSPQSTMVASASHDKTIRIWDAETGKCKRVLDGHSDSVTSVAFSHDSKKVASASQDKTIRIWDTKTGACERVLEGHSDSVSSVVFSHDSKRIVSGSYDKTIQIWDTEKSECKRVLQGHSDEVDSVAFSHDSKKVVSGSVDETVRIWDAETGKCKRVLEGHSHHVISVVFSHDSKKVASGSLDNTIRIWDAEIGRCEDVISLDRYAGVLSFTPDEHGIVTNRGTFALTGGSQSSAESATAWQSSKAAILTCIDDTWVTAAGKDLLWLPPECRDGRVAVSGSTVVIGCPSGRVVFLGISMAVDGYVTTEKIIAE